jgi:hypothetical protein
MTVETEQPKASIIRRTGGLLLGIGAIMVFMFVIAPYFDDKPYVKTLVDFIEYRGIDASALYYTEIEEFSTASIFMNNSRDYNPSNKN